MQRFVGIDVGAETIKVVELVREKGRLRWERSEILPHHEEPEPVTRGMLERLGWTEVAGAAGTGRLSRHLRLTKVPVKAARAMGFRYLHGDTPATVVSIGSHGFGVLELRGPGIEVMRENSRCSQGTGNFLRQLVSRFELDIAEASDLCADVTDAAPLSGRCPVILKTDMTHLANKGESRPRILAGLYDAVCENVQVLLKPNLSPPRVLLTGGVARSVRIQRNFARWCERHTMEMLPYDERSALFMDALGCALVAADKGALAKPPVSELFESAREQALDLLPPLAAFLGSVKRIVAPPPPPPRDARRLVLGFDIGSTGSKAVALDLDHDEVVWEGYLSTHGSPVHAAHALVRRFVADAAGRHPVLAFGATGSGRDIVGSLLASCYGSERVYVLNEIAAHAEGALFWDPRVDTIFEIGGQDAKYIRLADGKVVDAAMNEACSAGTGSFIEEQGKKFQGVESVVQLGEEAMLAESGVSLGQHCSVFMAEIIDEAVAVGTDNRSIIAGIYDSIIQNYLNRVKGNRSVGQVVFCQGMPFAADALAAAVVRQTGSEVVVPPNPGTVGALGIALLTRKALAAGVTTGADVSRFLTADVQAKETFICNATQGCGGAGNKCRIDRIRTLVEEKTQRFTWGGGCSLWDKGTGKKKLPDLTPDPFREREALLNQIIAHLSESRGKPTVGLTDEFQLKGLFPFFATFLYELGYDLRVTRGGNQAQLKRGIEGANVPFCAPMQQFHGVAAEMAAGRPDLLFLPMLRDIPKAGDEPHSVVCPIVQAAPDLLRWDLPQGGQARLVTTAINMDDGGLESAAFIKSCEQIAKDLGNAGSNWRQAYRSGLAAQISFDATLLDIGRRALDFCNQHGITPVIVLGRPYTIYNTVLNSNVPTLLREQGALAIPVDCYAVVDEAPVFHSMFWGQGQRNMRAAWQVRRRPGHYAIWCSNYSCGPDSFNLHFFAYQMEGKPFAVIETDGHSGDAGTKTRIEAFLHCVRSDLGRDEVCRPEATHLKAIEDDRCTMQDILRANELLLLPRMGPAADVLAAAMRGAGLRAEALPMPNRDTMRVGRRHTSGKECVPMCITLGSLLQRLESEPNKDERFTFFMPASQGPCRFGVYNILHKITLERLGYKERVRVWSPPDSNYFHGLPAGFSALVFCGFVAQDMLLSALLDVRPVEAQAGAANALYELYSKKLATQVEAASRRAPGVPYTLLQVTTGRMFGLANILDHAARDFARIKTELMIPTVAVVGEIYVRCDPFANDFLIERLEARGIRALFAPFTEWLEYTDYSNRTVVGSANQWSDLVSSAVKTRVLNRAYQLMASKLGWGPRTSVKESLAAAAPYVRPDLLGEAVLTVGGPLHEWQHGRIQGVVSAGPLECMPNKIAEAQFFHVAEHHGLPSLTLSLNGDPVDPQVLDNFAFEIQETWRKTHGPQARPQNHAIMTLHDGENGRDSSAHES